MHYGAYGSPIDPVAPPSRYLKLPVWTRTGGLSVSTSGMLRFTTSRHILRWFDDSRPSARFI